MGGDGESFLKKVFDESKKTEWSRDEHWEGCHKSTASIVSQRRTSSPVMEVWARGSAGLAGQIFVCKISYHYHMVLERL